MDEPLHTISEQHIENICDSVKDDLVKSLEQGKIIYLPNYCLVPSENESHLFTDSILDVGSKNVSYDYLRSNLSGVVKSSDLFVDIQQFMHRYALFAKHLLDKTLPLYSSNVIWGRTSFRPAEIKGRKSSKRKDDTRVHVDSFPSTPVAGRRILRIFSNVNPYGDPRVWHVGESFNDVIHKFKDEIPSYSNFKANLLKLIKATKTKRTVYDHYMLNLHDKMKLSDSYQATLEKKTIKFPAGSTWIVYTDHVSHAALSGQFLLEQTFYLPVEKMHNPNLSPLKHWERSSLI